MDERTVTLPIAEGQDLASISTQVRRFAEQLGITETPLTQLLSTTDECARKLLRWKKETASLILRARPSETILHWQAQNLRIAMDPNRAALSQTIAPVSKTLAPGSTTLAPGSATAPAGDLRVNALGTRWLFERMPKITQLERPHPRETVCGDMTMVERSGNRLRLVIADGLGHGPAAREAAQRAVNSLRSTMALDVSEAVLIAHEQVASTRGATLGVVDIDLAARLIRATTVGNVRVVLFLAAGRSWLPCGTDAVLGHGRGTFHGKLDIRVEQHPLLPGSTLAMFSDGLVNQLRLPLQRTPEQEDLATQLFSSFSVSTDDASLLLLS